MFPQTAFNIEPWKMEGDGSTDQRQKLLGMAAWLHVPFQDPNSPGFSSPASSPSGRQSLRDRRGLRLSLETKPYVPHWQLHGTDLKCHLVYIPIKVLEFVLIFNLHQFTQGAACDHIWTYYDIWRFRSKSRTGSKLRVVYYPKWPLPSPVGVVGYKGATNNKDILLDGQRE